MKAILYLFAIVLVIVAMMTSPANGDVTGNNFDPPQGGQCIALNEGCSRNGDCCSASCISSGLFGMGTKRCC